MKVEEQRTSSADRLFHDMLDRIHSGEWPVGGAIPSERDLMEEFGVSRIVLRESLSRLRVLGILNISHGKSSTVSKMDTEAFSRLFPLMLSFEGKESFENVCQVRLALEWQTAHLAAQHRTEEDIARMEELVVKLREELGEPLERASDTDLAFHTQVARATKNPLFPLLLEVLSGFVIYAQVFSCQDDFVRRERAVLAHEAIADAIRERDADRARAEMEAHVRYSMHYVMQSGKFESQNQQGLIGTSTDGKGVAAAIV